MSTIRKKAREKEDFPLPVRPQIPIWKQRSRCVAVALECAQVRGHSASSSLSFLTDQLLFGQAGPGVELFSCGGFREGSLGDPRVEYKHRWLVAWAMV